MTKGKIIALKGKNAEVEIKCNTACSGCRQKDTCQIKKMSRCVTVPVKHPENFAIGQLVDLEISTRSKLLGLFLAYIAPLLVLLGSLVTSLFLGYSETASALMALLAMIVYYFLLHPMNTEIAKHIIISIEQNSVD